MAEAVMAASTALPPARSTSMAARVASGEEVAAMPLVPKATDLPGWSKFLIG
jgi:hypothetical protein